MKRFIFLLTGFLYGCLEQDATKTSDGVTSASCRGIYYTRDSQGYLSKYNEYLLKSTGQCLTDKIALTNYEASAEKRRKNNVTCKPQPSFSSKALKADNGYYQYRNGRYFLDFDSTTGIFRRLTLGEDKITGEVVFQRDLACFYVREDLETEPVNPQNYGKQIMFDFSETPASSADFVPVEIFKYDNDNSGNWFFVRYDDSTDWSFSFCPQDTTPFFENCVAMRNGNIYFQPVLSSAMQTQLTIEAKLIRTQFTFSEITRSDFESLWNYYAQNTKELQQGGDWKYFVNHVVDANKFVDYDWRSYMKGSRPAMPDVGGAAGQLPPVCYNGSQYVVLSNGQKAKVNGTICYTNGVYDFVQN